jgi:hypothetical protein
MHDLFNSAVDLAQPQGPADAYSAADIEVLEGLEPVRRRPGMFIGGTDERALHHLVAELLDNSMDEAVAGHADWIDRQYSRAIATARTIRSGTSASGVINSLYSPITLTSTRFGRRI